MSLKKWGAALLAGAMGAGAFVGLGSTAAMAAEAPVPVTGATLEWGYSPYAQTGVIGAWQMSAAGDGLSIVTQNGLVASGDPAEAGRTYNVAQFQGGSGEIDAATGAGEISWGSGAVWTVQVTAPGGQPPAMLLSDPVLSIAEDRTGTLSFEVGATAGESMFGEVEAAIEPERVVAQNFSAVSIADGVITAVPEFAGVSYPGGADQVAGGGAWPASYLDQIPASVRAFHYQTALTGLNLRKSPVPFTVTTNIDVDVPATPAPKIELFDSNGEPLGNQLVEAGDEITFRASGFDPEANNPGGSGAGLPIPDNQPQGVFVAFGSVADPWQPSAGGLAENRTQVRTNTQWVLLDRVVDGLAEPLKTTISAASVTHQADGTFEGTIIAAEPSEVPANGSWGVYTYAGGATTVNAEQELFVPVNFAAEGNGGGSGAETSIGQNELVWGFKKSWREYVAGSAEGATVPGAKTEIDDNGLFHFTLADVSGYNAETGEGIIKYDGRIRFMSSVHGFDIVIEKPWVTFSDGGTAAVLSLAMSTTATVGDLTVSRVDAATLTPGAPADAEGTRTWTAVPGVFIDSVQPSAIARYIGESIDPVSFAVPVQSEESANETPGDETPIDEPGSETPDATDDAPQGADDEGADVTIVDPAVETVDEGEETAIEEHGPGFTPEGDPIESVSNGTAVDASGGSADAAQSAGLARTGAGGGAMTAAALGGVLLLAAGVALVARRRVKA